MDVAAFILAGGKSSRMGRDKAFLELAGKTLIARAIELARSVTDQVSILGAAEKFASYGLVVSDNFFDCGPLGGIHAGLTKSRCDLNLFIAVDLPFLTPGFLRFLVSQAKASGAVVTAPSSDGYFQPLCAVYRKQFGAIAEAALSSGHNKIDALFRQVELRVICAAELKANGFDSSIFRNLNTPEDWEQAKREFTLRPASHI